MSISRRSVAINNREVTFSPELLGRRLQEGHPELVFALLHGSAASGIVAPGSDIDLALSFREQPGWEALSAVMETVEQLVPGVPVDVGILNGNEPVYRFEALKGKLLFTADEEAWLRFYSLTCREYEHWMWHYEKQRRYRLGRSAG